MQEVRHQQFTLAPLTQEIHPGAFSSERALHPPVFHLDQHLSDWPECWLELRCPCSPRTVLHPVKMLLQRGDRPFKGVLAVLRCSACHGKPAPVYLVAGHVRDHTGGPLPSWAVQLVPGPR